jgi:hypothetical protein
MICEHRDGCFSVLYGPHAVARYAACGEPLRAETGKLRRKGEAAR